MLLKSLICLFPWFILAAAAEASQAKPGCKDTCGNVSIPYPFGVGEPYCYQQSGLQLVCNESYNPPRLLYSNIPLVSISLSNGTMTVGLGVTYYCYNQAGQFLNGWTWTFTLNENYYFSDTRNKFTAIGCDTNAVMSDSSVAIFKSGCMSVCANERSIVEGSCSGIGCCQTAIPKGLKTLNASLSSFYNHNYSWAYNPCSYAFFADSEQFNFSRSDLLNFTGMGPEIGNDISFPAVLDWVVGVETCEEAKRNLTSYACGDNSTCVDSTNGPGYRCQCNQGYEGNPYFTNGCQDIDECLAPENPCEKICTNMLGSFKCSCPRDYIDEGEQDGKNCTPIQNRLPILQLALGIGLGLLFLLIVGGLAYWSLRKRNHIQRKAKFFQQNGGLLLKRQISSTHGGGKESSYIFTADELERATNNYEEDRILGKGGYGTVYKGILPDKRIVAIKKSRIVDKSQIEQFINEFLILSQVTHPNVVKLLGCCLEAEVPLLVYEYVSNGNLFDHIHNTRGTYSISWDDRLRIAAETARALAYLHSAPSRPIIHRDVKSANILLDDNFTAKVADFGISKLVQLDQTQMSTLVQGTLGYLDPEYYHTSQLTEKSDVFSFGVVLVELLTGEKPICSKRSQEERSLATYFPASLKENRLFQLVEPQIINEGKSAQIIAYSELAKRCLNWKSEKRPTMKEIAMELERLKRFQIHPWTPQQRNEESTSLLSEPSDLYSVELTSYTGNASGQYSMEVMLLNVPPR